MIEMDKTNIGDLEVTINVDLSKFLAQVGDSPVCASVSQQDLDAVIPLTLSDARMYEKWCMTFINKEWGIDIDAIAH